MKMRSEPRISVENWYLSFNGCQTDAYSFVSHIRDVYDNSGYEMSKVLNDFIFAIEVALQNVGFLDENFNKIEEIENA